MKSRLTITRMACAASFVLLALLLVPTSAHADEFTVSINTSSLAPGSYSLGLVLLDASGTGDMNNSITLTDFNFGGGSGGATTFSTGGVSGDLASGTITLTETANEDGLLASFTPGTSISFDASMTTNPTTDVNGATGLTGDTFEVLLFDDGTEVNGPGPYGSYLMAEIGSDGTLTFAPAGVATPVPAPEPTSLLLLCGGLIALLGFGLTRKRLVLA